MMMVNIYKSYLILLFFFLFLFFFLNNFIYKTIIYTTYSINYTYIVLATYTTDTLDIYFSSIVLSHLNVSGNIAQVKQVDKYYPWI